MHLVSKLSKFPMPDFLWREYELDQRINDRGIRVDEELVRQAIAMDEKSRTQLEEEMKKLTGLENPNSILQLHDWLLSQGIETSELGKKTVQTLMENTSSEIVKRVLALRFVRALSELLGNKKQLISDCNEIIKDLTDNTEIDDELRVAEKERDNICILLDAAKKEVKAGKPMTDTFSDLEQRYDEVSATIASLERRRRDRTVRAAEIIKFIGAISTKEAEPDDFSEELWIATIDHLTVNTDSTLGFTYRTGEEVRVGV